MLKEVSKWAFEWLKLVAVVGGFVGALVFLVIYTEVPDTNVCVGTDEPVLVPHRSVVVYVDCDHT